MTASEDHNVKHGLLHVLQRHYSQIHDLGGVKADSTFPKDSTINEITGAIVKTVVEGEEVGSCDKRLRLRSQVEMSTPSHEGAKSHLLVAEESAPPGVHVLARSILKQHNSLGGSQQERRRTPGGRETSSVAEYLDRLNEALLERIQRSGEAFVSNAVVRGRYALR